MGADRDGGVSLRGRRGSRRGAMGGEERCFVALNSTKRLSGFLHELRARRTSQGMCTPPQPGTGCRPRRWCWDRRTVSSNCSRYRLCTPRTGCSRIEACPPHGSRPPCGRCLGILRSRRRCLAGRRGTDTASRSCSRRTSCGPDYIPNPGTPHRWCSHRQHPRREGLPPRSWARCYPRSCSSQNYSSREYSR